MGLTMRSLSVLIVGLSIIASIQSRSINQDSSFNDEAGSARNFQRTETLTEGYVVTWETDFEAETVTFELVVKTTGYVGFGFSSAGSMNDADLIIAGVHVNGTTYLEDRYVNAHTTPTLDALQNLVEIDVTESADTTTVKFSRAFDTGDAAQDNIITDEPTFFIWAIGSSDDLRYHQTARGAFEVNILEVPEDDQTTEGFTGTTGEYDNDVNFVRTQKLTPNFTVTWQVLFDTQQIIFDISAETKGYIGFGISNSGTMDPADLVIGGVRDDRTPYFADRYSAGHSTVEDASQDWELLEVRETETGTFLRVIRDFDTGDDLQDIAITREWSHFLWAIGADDDIERHAERGSYSVNILEAIESQNFVRYEEINANISVSWEVDYVDQIVIFEVLGNTKGYIGFGLSEQGEMAGMDLIIGGVNDDHTSYFADHFAVGHSPPAKDTQQDWYLLAARELGEQTYLKFVRRFDTGDSADLRITNAETNLMWALGATDDITRRHASRGVFPVNLLQAPSVQANFEREIELSSDFLLSYHVNFLMRRITFEATVASTGYVGFGIAPSGTMTDADMIIGGVDSEGISYFDDRVSLRHGVPAVDKYQDWFLESATENNQTTQLTFYRNLNTMDILEDYAILDEDTFIVWAIGSSDDLTRHATRGNYKLNFFQAVAPTTVAPTSESPPRANFERSETLAEGYNVKWAVDFEREIISFELTVAAVGYVALGFSKDGSMTNADIVFGGVKEDGTKYLEDRFATGHTTPLLDASQDYTLEDATQSETTTVLKFSRAFNTGDSAQDAPILFEQTNFIWAIGDGDDIAYHAKRGSFPVNILQAPGGASTPEDDSTVAPGPAPASALSTSLTFLLLSLSFAIVYLV